MEDLIWYASYGSNILSSRFLCYIEGGSPLGATREYIGCTNKTPPQAAHAIRIPYNLYFSKQSSIWEGMGVAFLNSKKDTAAITFGRMYLITREQFTQVVRQENDMMPSDDSIDIDFKTTIENGDSQIDANWYSKIIYLGIEYGHPIFTFTSAWPEHEIKKEPPGEKYLKTIITGIKECYELTDEEIVEYLSKLDGINGYINKATIERLVANC